MSYPQVFENSTLKTDGSQMQPERIGNDGEPHFVYNPYSWLPVQVMATIRGQLTENTQDPQNINSVQPRNGFLAVETNNRSSLIRVAKANFQTKKNQRYLFKMLVNQDLEFEGSGGDFSTIQYRIVYIVNGAEYPQPWTHTDFKQDRAVLLELLHSNIATEIGVAFEIWNVWGNTLGNVFIKSIEALEVPNTYGAKFFSLGIPEETPLPVIPPIIPDDVQEIIEKLLEKPEVRYGLLAIGIFLLLVLLRNIFKGD